MDSVAVVDGTIQDSACLVSSWLSALGFLFPVRDVRPDEPQETQYEYYPLIPEQSRTQCHGSPWKDSHAITRDKKCHLQIDQDDTIDPDYKPQGPSLQSQLHLRS